MNAKASTSELPVQLPVAHPETGQWRSMVFSFGLHLMLLLAFFGFTYSTGGGGDSVEPDRSAGIVLTVQSSPTEEQQYLDETDFQPSESNDTPAEASANQPTQDAAPEIAAVQSPTEIDLPGLKFDTFSDASKMTSPNAQGLNVSRELSEEVLCDPKDPRRVFRCLGRGSWKDDRFCFCWIDPRVWEVKVWESFRLLEENSLQR